ncbi:hypothetical protein SYYSPA8_29295 [Streptomyces yaizuensis]|uniref:Uncharacterized protein n=1 Tax=Streptomyces yaizuensis TaxID=2989713 RepID=A0ABQ5P7B4_9ACTN|nr:hypothetical protein SYYSPA8_29295 [Streptomyces sp. YSPA8]
MPLLLAHTERSDAPAEVPGDVPAEVPGGDSVVRSA